MRITALIENTARGDLGLDGEQGLSLHIQRNDDRILFDTGASGKFMENAKKLDIDLKDVDVTAISHGHYDHGGGLRSFLEVNQKSPVYMRAKADGDHYFKAFLILKKDIGIEKAVFNDYNDRIHFINEFTEITRDVYLLTNINLKYPIPAGDKYIYTKKKGRMVHDDFIHEQMMAIKDDDGLIIFTGCSHHGVLNMVEAIFEKFPNMLIKALFGGFHFIGLPFFNHLAESKPTVENIGRKLLEYPIEKVYTGHCTGRKAYPILKSVMGDKAEYLATGNSVDL
jgi:7,8-dihydropterin-6-yl-methyl-4-(beta-D-ribofuranosyl)aminobenzene 5'-phosphate synthase